MAAHNEDYRLKIPTILQLVRLRYEYLSLKGQTWDETFINRGIAITKEIS